MFSVKIDKVDNGFIVSLFKPPVMGQRAEEKVTIYQTLDAVLEYIKSEVR